ncbi:hypothetical protein TSOC_000867 [Tetrabaena socialis]|uniref:Uncharacterized protein n=1 Tax=Tetrabaena socialis TaxID=47790 RepID=A0A2J8AIC1_9CHLO|nr:hypothetical protein TSOC_000867 [Tetrabaena socialis]|eukprot:PNH12264.1 hypothetical protein TSOC_000867 [Tetrabaena socialis]
MRTCTHAEAVDPRMVVITAARLRLGAVQARVAVEVAASAKKVESALGGTVSLGSMASGTQAAAHRRKVLGLSEAEGAEISATASMDEAAKKAEADDDASFF